MQERITLTDVRAVAGLSKSEANEAMDRLVLQRILEPLEPGKVYTLSPRLRERYFATLPSVEAESGQSEGRVETELQPESLAFRVISTLTERPLGKAEIAATLGLKTISGQLNKVVRELIDQGLIDYTISEKPQSRLQKYRVTKDGRELLANRRL